MKKMIKIAAGCVLAGGAILTAQAQESASATVTEISGGTSGPYTYQFTLTDTGSTTIGSVWYAWTPGFNYLQSKPTGTSGDTAGWANTIIGSTGAASIQFKAGGSADYLQPGQSASFDFTTADSPSALEGTSGGTPIGTSVAYSGGLFSDGGFTFVASTSSTPEPSSYALMGMTALGWLGWRKKAKAAASK